jgi:hypothetical protein
MVRISTNIALRTEIEHYNTIQLSLINPLDFTAQWSVTKVAAAATTTTTTTTTIIIIIITIIIIIIIE